MRLRSIGSFGLILITLLLLTMVQLPVVASSEDEEIQHGLSQDLPKALGYYLDNSGAYTEVKDGSKVLTFTMALASMGMSQELLNIPETVEEEDYPFSIDDALAPLDWAFKYFNAPYKGDERGYVNFYDLEQGDDSFSRASKRTSDQVLMIRAAIQGIALLNRKTTTSAKIPTWSKAISDTWEFIEDRLYDSTYGGWAIAVTPINNTHYATDWTKTVESNSWTIISLLPSLETISSITDLNSETIKSRCIQTMNLLGTHLLEPTGQVRPFSSRDGMIKPEFTTCRDLALFGLASMESYRTTNNQTYLLWAKQVANYAIAELWDNGFGGFFGSVSDEGNILVAGKKIEDNFLAAQLLCQLVVHDTGDLYEPILAILLSLLREILGHELGTTNKILYPTAVDRKLLSNGIFNARTQSIATFSLSELPHIIYLTRQNFYPIGRETPLILNVQLGYLPKILLRIQGETTGIDISQNITTQDLSNIQLLPVQGSRVGYHSLVLTLSIREIVFEKPILQIRCGGDILIPQGIIYLLALGVIAGVVIVIITPPALLKKWLGYWIPLLGTESLYSPQDVSPEYQLPEDEPMEGKVD
ncbi:MAG: hypothetical protein ACFFCZ_13350 [Promethearchaeota archaeon]